MNAIRDRLSDCPRQQRSILPTPVQRLEHLCQAFQTGVYCKRDDLTGFGFGGNKTRKLDFLLPDALSDGCDTLIGIGANQSNFCRAAAAYGAANNMEVHLVLGGKEPQIATGNLGLDHLLGAHCHHVDSADWNDWESEAARLQAELSKAGRKVYRMPIGGSTPVGALGYVDAFAEIMEDQDRLGIGFDTIVHASSSAGTQAGLVVGKELTGWQGRIIGMSVAKMKEELEKNVFTLASETAAMFDRSVEPESVLADDGYLGDGYAKRTAECVEAVELFARKCGIFLDYVYTGKAAAGLIDYLRQGHFGTDQNVLFIHTGGGPELFE